MKWDSVKDGRQKTEVRRRKSEDLRPKTEDGRPETEDETSIFKLIWILSFYSLLNVMLFL